MAISIDWPTGVITVPQADLTHISGTLYELDTDAFRLELKSLEDDAAGMGFPKTHNHNTNYTVAGVTYARAILILAPYSVEFEDGAYSVRLVGSNNNIFDVENGILVQNSVQVISGNSAGLIQVTSGSGVLPADIVAIADAVWDEDNASHSTTDTYGKLISTIDTLMEELHRVRGLKLGSPATQTTTELTAGDITIEVTGDPETSITFTRQP